MGGLPVDLWCANGYIKTFVWGFVNMFYTSDSTQTFGFSNWLRFTGGSTQTFAVFHLTCCIEVVLSRHLIDIWLQINVLWTSFLKKFVWVSTNKNYITNTNWLCQTYLNLANINFISHLFHKSSCNFHFFFILSILNTYFLVCRTCTCERPNIGHAPARGQTQDMYLWRPNLGPVHLRGGTWREASAGVSWWLWNGLSIEKEEWF